jgi:hypothetical protein
MDIREDVRANTSLVKQQSSSCEQLLDKLGVYYWEILTNWNEEANHPV